MIATDAPVEDDLRQAIILNPEFSPAYALLGLFLSLEAQRSDEGLTLAQAVSLDPSNASHQLTVAHVLAQMKRYDQARAAAQRAGALARDAHEKAVIDKVYFPSPTERAKQFRTRFLKLTARRNL